MNSTSDPYVSMTDEAELARLRGVGIVAYDEASDEDDAELREMLGMEDLNDGSNPR